MMTLTQNQKIKLVCAVFMAFVMFGAFWMFFPQKYEAKDVINIPQLGDMPDSPQAQAITVSGILQTINNRAFTDEAGLRLLASHIYLFNEGSDVFSSKRFKRMFRTIPEDILALADANEFMTYSNLLSYVESRPALFEALNTSIAALYYGRIAFSSVSVSQNETGDKITLAFRSDDPIICQQSLDIIMELSMRGFEDRYVTERYSSSMVDVYMPAVWALVGGVFGFLLSFGLITMKTKVGRKLITPERAEKRTGLEVSGVLPNSKIMSMNKNFDQIKNSLLYNLLFSIFHQTPEKQQHRILITSIYPEEGRVFVSNTMSEWLLRKGKKCTVITPYFEDDTWYLKYHNTSDEEVVSIESLTKSDVLIMIVPPLITGDYPVELFWDFNTAFLVCDADRAWTPENLELLYGFMDKSSHIPQVILNNVEMSVVNKMLKQINVIKTHFAPAKRTVERSIRKKNKRIINDRELAQKIVKETPNLGVILDSNRQIVYANEAITSLLGLGNMDKTLGLRPGELVSCVYSDVMTGGCGTSKACQQCGAVNTIVKCLKSRKRQEGECEISSFMNGQLVPFKFKISCSPLELQNEYFVIANLTDIKGEEDKKEQLMTSVRAGAEANQDLSGLSDLLKNVGETGHLENLLDVMKSGSIDHAEEAAAESQRLTDAENGELTANFESLSAFAILNNVVSMARSKNMQQSREIMLAPPFPSVYVMTDTNIFEHVLRCMLRNAVEATPVAETVYIGYEITGFTVTFYVSNPGSIPAEHQGLIFEKGFTTKESRKGLGTYSMKLLGETYLYGQVDFQTDENTGTKFFISLPIPGTN